MDPVSRLLHRWKNEAQFLRRSGHPGARLRRIDIEELERALREFVNEPLPQTVVAELLEKDTSTIRRRTGGGGLRNVGTRHRPRYLRGEVQKLPREWGLADGEVRDSEGDDLDVDEPSSLPDEEPEVQLPSRAQVARAIAQGARDGQ